jgi:hypothetical protein
LQWKVDYQQRDQQRRLFAGLSSANAATGRETATGLSYLNQKIGRCQLIDGGLAANYAIGGC